MIRPRLVSVKHVFSALAILILLIGSVEVGLRVHDSWTRPMRGLSVDTHPLLTRSWVMHHRLQPGQSRTVRHPDHGTAVELRINSFGLRGPEPAVPKPPGTYRILCLGDETTMAPEGAETETFCSRLADRLQSHMPLDVDVINAGVPGYCPLLSYLQVRHSLLALQPDLVVVNFDMSDVADDYRYRRHTQTDANQTPLACPHPALPSDASERQESDWSERLLSVRWLKGQAFHWTASQDPAGDEQTILSRSGRYAWLRDQAPDWSLYIRQAFSPLVHLDRLLQGNYGRLVVAAAPAPWQISPKASTGEGVREQAGVPQDAVYHSRRPFERLSEYCRQHGIPFCDPSSKFRAAEHPERLFLENAPRFSQQGHDLYAEKLAEWILHHVPGPWMRPLSDRSDPQRGAPAFSTKR